MDWRDAEREFEGPVMGMSTMPELFEASVERHEHRPAQRYKGGVYNRSLTETVLPEPPDGEFRSVPYTELRSIVRHLATGFRELGVADGKRVGIFSDTRMEWAQTDFALLAAGGVVTTVYKSSSRDQVQYLLDDPDATGIVVENEDCLERVLEVEDELSLSFIVLFDQPTPGSTAATAHDNRDDIYTLAEVHDKGAEQYDRETYESWLDEREPSDLCSLIYTSGTTGQPKGVQLTHANFRSNVNQIYARLGPRPDKDDSVPVIDEHAQTVSFLPLAHVFERTAGHFLMFGAGACVAYAESPDTLRDDFQTVGPTTATSVPRVYEKIYDAIREQAQESNIKERIFEWATDVGRQYQRTDNPGAVLQAKRGVADRLVFSTVKDALGGNIEFLVSGGGSLSPDLCELFHGMGLPIMEGYGLTETAPVVAVNPVEAPKVGTIGPPVIDVEARIDETAVGEDEFPDDEGTVGELLVQGPNVTDGYWNKPKATEEAFIEDEDGRWFRTGDIVHQRPDEYLEFRERAKQILVLSTGKNVAPAPIEDAFSASQVVEQCMVIGDERKFVSAVIVPNLDYLRDQAAQEGVTLPPEDEAACDHDWVRQQIQTEVDEINPQFEQYEQIKKFALVPIEFTEDNDLLTPTMKKKRRDILDRFEQKVELLYDDA